MKRNLQKQNFEIAITSTNSTIKVGQIEHQSNYHLPFFIKSTWQYVLPFLTVGTTLNYRSGTTYTPVLTAINRMNGNIYEPILSFPNSLRLPNYFRTDLLMSKYLSSKNTNSWIFYCTIGNVFNIDNVKEYSYNYDYSEINADLFQKRTYYFGLIYSFHK